ncbi:MAG: GNAT family N-acetyltransferase [Gemmatimonadetes bacterium]|nr:GNAT family N-acetyltransferase [Gemmatimonadota bacterium]
MSVAPALRLERLSAGSEAALLAHARTLMAEYGAMPHIDGRWMTVAQDVARLPVPFLPPTGCFLVAFLDDEPVGCGGVIALDPPAICELKRVYVRPAARGHHVGAELTQALMREAVALGFTTMRLDTAPELLAAQRMYEGFGFHRIPRYKPDQIPDTFCYERALDPADHA